MRALEARLSRHANEKSLSGATCHYAQGGQRPIAQRRSFETALSKPGDDLLSQALRLSTIGAGVFHGRVREGIGWVHSAKITRPAKGGFNSGLNPRI